MRSILDSFRFEKKNDKVLGGGFQIIQCCSLGQLKQYNPNDVIYAIDKGRLNSVYFVLRGNCTILQTLKMTVWQSNNQTKCICNYLQYSILKYTNINQTKKYYLADVEDLDSPARLLLEKLNFEADEKRKFSTIPTEDAEKKYL